MERYCKAKSGILVALMLIAALGIAQAQNCAQPAGLGKTPVKLICWNIQNGMWDGQGDNYDRFVAWVNAHNPDICVWIEAQTNYQTDSDKGLPKAERYLPDGWSELAARYGHSYVWKGAHHDGFPQVITSKYPIQGIERLYGSKEGISLDNLTEADTLVRHGAGWAAIDIAGRHINIVTLHLAPHQWGPWARTPQEREASKAKFEGDKFRRREIQYICEHTILSEAAGRLTANENDLWMMMGDFNSRSRLDNEIYHQDENSTKFYVHDYILGETPYKDILRVKHPDEFPQTMYYECRLDYIYVSPGLCNYVESAEVQNDEFTAQVRDPQELSNFWRPSDHRPIVVTFSL